AFSRRCRFLPPRMRETCDGDTPSTLASTSPVTPNRVAALSVALVRMADSSATGRGSGALRMTHAPVFLGNNTAKYLLWKGTISEGVDALVARRPARRNARRRPLAALRHS